MTMALQTVNPTGRFRIPKKMRVATKRRDLWRDNSTS